MFLERSATVCLDFELVQLSWAQQLNDYFANLKISRAFAFCFLCFALLCFSLELCVYFAVYLSIRSNRSGSISLVSVSFSVSISISVCSAFNALAALSRSQFVVCLIDLIAWVWWPVQDTTRRDATTLAVYVRDVDSSSSSSLDLICFDWLLPPFISLPPAMSNVMLRVHFRLHASPTTAASRNYAFKRVQNNQLVPFTGDQ